MSGLMLCSSALAEHPYKIKETGLLIYSAEELSYYVYHNFYLIEEDFICEELINFLEEELKLSDSASKLRQLVKERSSLFRCLIFFLREFHYYNEAEIKDFQTKYEAFRVKSPASRKLLKADFLMNQGFYLSAIQIYHQFDDVRKNSADGDEYFAKARQHMAVSYMELGLYEEAMQSFEEAYEKEKTENLLKQIYQFSVMSDCEIPTEISHEIDPEKETEWKKEYDETLSQGNLLATTGQTAAIFTKDSIRRRECLKRHIEEIKKQYRMAIS